MQLGLFFVARFSSFSQRDWPLLDWRIASGHAGSPRVTVGKGCPVADGQAFTDAAINGFGIAQIIDHVAQPHVDAGRPVPILPEASINGLPIHAIIPLGRRMAAKTRAVLDALVQAMR